MADEIRMHLELRTERNIAAGMTRDEAREAALRSFGGVEQIKERVREQRVGAWIDEVIRNLRIALRVLRKDTMFATLAILTMALCVGANTAIFSVIYALMLRPLPFPAQGRVVEIYNTFTRAGLEKEPCSLVQYLDYKNQTISYEAVGLWGPAMAMIDEDGATQLIPTARCTPEMLEVLGVKPLIGSFFSKENSRFGEDRVIVLTQSYWEARYDKDPQVISRTLRVDGESFRIVGVAPRSVEAFDPRSKFIRPIAWNPEMTSPMRRFALNTPLFARIKPGVTASAALSEAAVVEQRYHDWAPENMRAFLDSAGHRMAIVPIQTERARPVRSSLFLLQAGAVFVLLIGCLNLANLLLTRTNSRRAEISIRCALGASRGAIVRQLLVENMLLTISGILVGVALALACLPVASRFVLRVLPDALPITLNLEALCIAISLISLAGLLVGFVPVMQILNSQPSGGAPGGTRVASVGRGSRTFSSVLVTGQIASALVLLVGAGLLVRSFANAISVRPGFDPNGVVVASMALPAAYGAQEKATSIQGALIGALREIPGVEDEAIATSIPFKGVEDSRPFTPINSGLAEGSAQPVARFIGVSAGYFHALGIQLLKGRFFDQTDATPGRNAYIVDDRFERKYFPGRSAVGGRFRFEQAPGTPPQPDSEIPVIIGVVRFVPHDGVEDRSNNPYLYYPVANSSPRGLNLFVRSTRPDGDLVTAIREKIRGVDPGIAVFGTGTLRAAVDGSFENRRAIMAVLGGFAALALFLAAIGIYGILSYDVSQRTREIGIRGAIGGSQNQIVSMVMRQGLTKTGIGLVTGIVCSVLLGRFMAGMLFDLKPGDPWSYIFASALLGVVAFVASYIPARKAAKIDPIQALRTD